MNLTKETPEATVVKSNCFLGYARIDFPQLSFEDSMRQNHREESHKATARLLRVFRLEGCKRYDVENFIDATIPLHAFQEAIAPADASNFQDTGNVRQLRLQHSVACQNGLHRIAAARDYLPFNNRWWIVRLYSREGFNKRQDLTSYTRASFAHEQRYSDGHIFRNIRLAYHEKSYKEEKMCGMWEPIQLGTLHRFHGLRYPEELLNYLKHILDVWCRIEPLASYVDSATVRGLELRAPGVSKADLQEIMQNSEILSAASDVERTKAIEQFRQTKCIIPSLRTFFENQKYLEPCSSILRKLLGACKPKQSLEAGFGARYFGRDSFIIQRSENHVLAFPLQEAGTLNRGWERKLGYVQLWMFCLRNYAEMTEMAPKLGSRRVKAKKKYNQALWHRLATLAWSLGFDTEEIRRLRDQDPDKAQVRRLLQTIRPYHNVDHKVIEEVSSIVSTGRLTSSTRYPTNIRCGQPHYDDYEEDKDNLFLPLLWQKVDEENEDVDVTALYRKQDLLYAFFGKEILEVSPSFDTMVLQPVDLFSRSSRRPILASEAEVTQLTRDLRAAQNRLEEISRLHEGTQRCVVELSKEKEALQITLQAEMQKVLEKEDANFALQRRLEEQEVAALEAPNSQILLEEKDFRIAELEAKVLKLTELGSQMQTKEEEITTLRTDMETKDQTVTELLNTIEAKDVMCTRL
ncbi:hypothetical protein BU23DRAFT_568532 [Bimuria novae-zelandiae CBS 107.79]|uniref:Uncharacterized protein n=1 Tax=Bimuria novae-zelandiae CBS 107.79 TaxID=1447943 RepID=A0A6A5V7Y2_9PLEO|nr:hypothetical protein BU23DRAFT_568532 [Bimuria novae-zelandiae CBS 107.79]